jgi:hypothetical protein
VATPTPQAAYFYQAAEKDMSKEQHSLPKPVGSTKQGDLAASTKIKPESAVALLQFLPDPIPSFKMHPVSPVTFGTTTERPANTVARPRAPGFRFIRLQHRLQHRLQQVETPAPYQLLRNEAQMKLLTPRIPTTKIARITSSSGCAEPKRH